VNLSELFDKWTGSAASMESRAPQSNLKVTQLFGGKLATSQILTASDDAGHISDLIHCNWSVGIPAEPHCRYLLADGDFSFDLAIDDPSPWREIKKNLMTLLASFEPVDRVRSGGLGHIPIWHVTRAGALTP
jgi:hypothetical protein